MIFLMGLIVSALLIGLLCIVIRFRYRRQSPFRARLSIRFLLIVLLPVIPMTFLVSILLTQSAELLLPPKTADAMESALNAMRIEMERSAETILTENPLESWHADKRKEKNIHCLLIYRIQPDTIRLIQRIQSDSCILDADWQPQQTHLKERWQRGHSSRILNVGNQSLFTYFSSRPDSQLICLVSRIPAHWEETQQRLNRAINQYNTLVLFKESILNRNLVWILAFTFVALIVVMTLWIAQRMSRELTQPIRHLVTGMQRVATGDLSARIDCEAKDEFRFLIDHFNTMTRDLAEASRRLIQAEKLAAWQTVARQLSHEIKNSLTPVTISLRRLKTKLGETIPDTIQQILITIQEELCVLENMANAFSEFARLPEPVKQPVLINPVIEAAVLLQQESHTDLNITLLLDENLPEIEADRDQLKRVFNNLIKNAIEAAEDVPMISITSGLLDKDKILITVQDQGKGLDAKTLDQIFRPYFTTKLRGTGLGMAMVQKIIQDHQGDISIKSQPGQGTMIRIIIPVMKTIHSL